MLLIGGLAVILPRAASSRPCGVFLDERNNIRNPISISLSGDRVAYVAMGDGVIRAYSLEVRDKVTEIAKVGPIVPYSFGVHLATRSDGILYATDSFHHRVLLFTLNGNKFVQVGAIGGRKTTLGKIYNIGLDSQDNLYVVGVDASNDSPEVAEFRSHDVGDVTPIRVILGATTHLVDPRAVAVDRLGQILVSNNRLFPDPSSVVVFSSDAVGNAAPNRVIAGRTATMSDAQSRDYDLHDIGSETDLNGPVALAIGSGGRLFVANARGGNVTVYPSGASGDVRPIETLDGDDLLSPRALAFGNDGRLYVADSYKDRVLTYCF